MRSYWQRFARDGAYNTPHLHHIFPSRVAPLVELPPAIVITAACTPLYDEGCAEAEHLHLAGVPTNRRR